MVDLLLDKVPETLEGVSMRPRARLALGHTASGLRNLDVGHSALVLVVDCIDRRLGRPGMPVSLKNVSLVLLFLVLVDHVRILSLGCGMRLNPNPSLTLTLSPVLRYAVEVLGWLCDLDSNAGNFCNTGTFCKNCLGKSACSVGSPCNDCTVCRVCLENVQIAPNAPRRKFQSRCAPTFLAPWLYVL